MAWRGWRTIPGDAVGKPIPYGVYDVASNDGFVSVGVDHDTPVFAVKSIEAWWKRVGQDRYPTARELFTTADADCSNGYAITCWKQPLQRLADTLDLVSRSLARPPVTLPAARRELRRVVDFSRRVFGG